MGKLIFGVIFIFFGVLGFLDALTTRNQVAAIGGFTISLILLIVGVPLAMKGAKGKPQEDGRKCPDCAEIIKSEAKVCRYCGKKFEVAV